MHWACPSSQTSHLYVDALTVTVVGHPLVALRLRSPFVLRSVTPPLESLHGRTVRSITRLGKRIVLDFSAGDELFLVMHLMIAGRLRWRAGDTKAALGAGEADAGDSRVRSTARLFFTEAGTKKRASLQSSRGARRSTALDPGGIEPLEATLDVFRAALTRESHTLKRALTDPHLFSGIGNAYSDEILHAARLSPLKLTRRVGATENGSGCTTRRGRR